MNIVIWQLFWALTVHLIRRTAEQSSAAQTDLRNSTFSGALTLFL